MRALLISLFLLCGCALPAAAQTTGSIQVSLTILEPAQAQVEPTVTVERMAGGALQVEAQLRLRGGGTWSLSQGALLPASVRTPVSESGCGAWAGSAAPAAAEHSPRLERRVTARAVCEVGDRNGTALAPLVIVLAAN